MVTHWVTISNFNELCHIPTNWIYLGTKMHELASTATRNKGVVLEVGFGLGISAGFIQRYQPREHIVIEANLEVLGTSVQFSENSRYPVRTMV